jgi:hypothetical protein
VEFVAEKTGALEVTRATSGHLLVKPLVNDHDVGWFIFDTGAGITCIDKAVADKIALPAAGNITAQGMGGDQASKLRSADSVSLGPVALRDTALLELDLKGFQIFMGKPIAGVIGYEVFGAAVFEVDLAAGAIIVHDPSTFKLENEAQWSKMHMIRRRPYIEGTMEGNEAGLFVLDIGSNSGLIVHSPAVEKFKLLDGRETTKTMTGGVGGLKSMHRGRLKQITVAGNAIEDVDTTFSSTKTGGMASDDAQATVGVAVLKQFRLIIDYPNSRIALIKP